MNAGSGGDVVAADDVAGVKYQVVKLAVGADGAASLVANANPVPVSDAGGALTVDGTVTVVGAAAEDAAASGNPVLIGGRYDSPARTLETGDVGALALNSSGQLLVEIAAGAGSGGTSAADDADFTAGTTSGTPVMGSYQSSPTAVTDGDMGIIGITADREVKVSVTSGGVSGKVDDAAFTAGTDEGVLLMGVASSDSVDSGDAGAVAMTTGRALHVAVQSLPASTNTIEMVGDVAQDAAVAGNPVLVGGRASTATPTAMSADGDSVYQWLTRTGAAVVSGDLVDDAAFTPGTSRVQAIGLQADETATDSVDEGDIGAARMTLDRKQIVAQYAHAAAGGATPFRNIDVDESEDAVKASAGKLYTLHVMNMAASVRYLKIYNATTANVTVGSTTPVFTFPIPTLGDTNGAGFVIHFGDLGAQFDTAITIAATTGLADADTGAPGANEVIVNGTYA